MTVMSVLTIGLQSCSSSEEGDEEGSEETAENEEEEEEAAGPCGDAMGLIVGTWQGESMSFDMEMSEEDKAFLDEMIADYIQNVVIVMNEDGTSTMTDPENGEQAANWAMGDDCSTFTVMPDEEGEEDVVFTIDELSETTFTMSAEDEAAGGKYSMTMSRAE